MKDRVLHVFKQTYTKPQHLYLGAVKDIRGRTEYFQTRGIAYDELLTSSKRVYHDVLSQMPVEDLQRYTAVVFEMTFSPAAIPFVRTYAPQATIITRSHNAELLHRLDWARAQGFSRGSISILKVALKNFVRDYLSGKRSDFLLSIDKWEVDHYWSHLIDKSKLKYVPSFLPGFYEATLPRENAKKLQCVNLTSTDPNPLIIDATKKFASVVQNLGARCREWSFCITGDETRFPIQTPDRIRWTGFLDSPYQVLVESQAMALLSDYGYGFRTKILEAILAKTFILMSEGLYRRMPDEVRPYCIPIDVRSSISFQEALEQCKKPYPEGNPNAEFRQQAFAVLDELFLK